jgi:hypothetical protein
MAVTCGIYPEYKVDKTVFIAELINYASPIMRPLHARML